MAKLLEMNGGEMCAALVSVAASVRSFLDDEEFINAFRECTKKGIKSRLEGILNVYADMIPLLFGEKHLRDTLKILAIIEGTTVNKMLKMSGVELMADAMNAWKEQLQPFFTRLGLSV